MEAMDSKIAESSVARVRREFGYIISYESNLQKVRMEVNNLQAKRDCVQHYMYKAERNGEKIVDVVVTWREKVNVIIDNAKKLTNINNDVGVEAKEKYCMKYFPNLRFRQQQSKKYQKMKQDIHQVLTEANFQIISNPVAIIGPGSKLSTQKEILKEIHNVLKDPNIYMIGLYGTDGVGKTTLVKELALQVEKDELFNYVVIAEVTDPPDVGYIQGQIANALNMKFAEYTTRSREEQLYQEIKEKKSILVILDDIWVKLDLEKVGIPVGDDHKGCKLLLTSEHRNVLKCQMGTQKNFRLDVLSDEDSWQLFQKIAGNDIQMNNIQSIAQDVAKCCDGLPLFIVAVAKALRERDVSTWENALYKLKKTDEQGLSKEFICPLELSYHCLKSDELKSFFLFIASVGQGCIHNGELFSCYRGLYGDLHTITEAKNKYYKLISDLKSSSLLLEGETGYVRMHADVRDTIKAIGSGTHLTYEVQKFTEMVQWDLDQLRASHYINLPSYDIDELPEKLDCPELKILSLRRNHGYLTIPDNFFSGMRKVKVLNLHGMEFSPSPPSSLRLLTNLISLNLYACVLEDIALIAELKSLKILTLESSTIIELPNEIGQLVYLQILNLTNCYELSFIPTNILSGLTRLEELYMGNCNIKWEVDGGKSKASVSELSHLNQLTTLDISINDASALPRDMNVCPNLQKYNISVGFMSRLSSLWHWDAPERLRIRELSEFSNSIMSLQGWWDVRQCLRTLNLFDSGKTNIWLNHWVKVLLTTVEHLSIAYLNFGKDEDDQSIPMALFYQKVAMPNLEILELYSIDSHKIWDDKLTVHFYNPNLRMLSVVQCKNLQSLFSPSATRALSKLQHLKIQACRRLEEIFVQQEEVTFPNLETLFIGFMDLKSIWNNQQAPNSFCKLKRLKIMFCDSLRRVLPILVAKELQQLQELQISFCDYIESVIVENAHSRDAQDEVASAKLDEAKFGIESKGDALGDDVTSMNLEELKYKDGEPRETLIFMKLEKLDLRRLPRVKSFCKASYNFKFPVLHRVHVIGCYKMKTFCNGNVITPSLSKVQYGSQHRPVEYRLDGDLNTTLKRLAK